MPDVAYAVVYEAPTELDVVIAKDLLEDAGIPVIVRPIGEVWERLYFGPANRPIAEILVPSEQVAQAEQLLADYRAQVEAGAFTLSDDAGEDTGG